MIRKTSFYLVIVAAFALTCNLVLAGVVVSTFDEITLPPASHWGGAGSGETGFTSGDAFFPHNDAGWSWDGFVFSNETDNTTLDYNNDTSAITGGGIDGSQYGLCYMPLDWLDPSYPTVPQTVTLGNGSGLPFLAHGAYFTNTTYAYLAMRDGYSPAKKFGGADGSDPDYFKLIISGLLPDGTATANSVEFYLADFRGDENYIVDSWTWVNLTELGPVAALTFDLASSDVGAWGINTPTYFAIDNLTTEVIPEPATMALLLTGALATLRRRR